MGLIKDLDRKPTYSDPMGWQKILEEHRQYLQEKDYRIRRRFRLTVVIAVSVVMVFIAFWLYCYK